MAAPIMMMALGMHSDENAMWELEEDEWGLGDKAYCGIKQMLCGNKPAPEETEFDTFWNSLISFYRGRI